jgi:hypothetical protein
MTEKKDTPFGGISVLVLGDFKQLQPVTGQWIFAKSVTGYRALQPYETNALWDMFEILELVQFMRQANDLDFAIALETIGKDGLIALNEEQVKMFDARIVSDKDNPKLDLFPVEIIFAFHTNESVEQHNRQKVKYMKQSDAANQLFLNRAEHLIIADSDKARAEANHNMQFIDNVPASKSNNLPKELELKVGLKYVITRNIDIRDYLVNGTMGTLKHIIFDKDNKYAEVLFLDYGDDKVGNMQRDKYKSKFENNSKVRANWTPMYRESIALRMSKGSTWKIERKQFQLLLCEGQTIHKCQGQTYDGLGLNIGQPLTTAMLYVALSRVRRIEDLYLYGRRSIVHNRPFSGWPPKRRQDHIRNARKTNPIHVEIKRMHEYKPFTNMLPILKFRDERLIQQDKIWLSEGRIETYNEHNSIAIIFNKMDNFHLDKEFICKDYGMMNADILIFTGRTTSSDFNLMNLDNFTNIGYAHSDQGCDDEFNYTAIYVRTQGNVRSKVETLICTSSTFRPKDPTIKQPVGILKIQTYDKESKPTYLCFFTNCNPELDPDNKKTWKCARRFLRESKLNKFNFIKSINIY